jgi:hypothetical protein
MKLLVCLKQILDPEIPARDVRVEPIRREAERGAANLVTIGLHRQSLAQRTFSRRRTERKPSLTVGLLPDFSNR